MKTNFDLVWYFRPTFFGAINELEDGCLRLTNTPSDMLVMPANYLHFVLTKDIMVFYSLFELWTQAIWLEIKIYTNYYLNLLYIILVSRQN